MKFQDGLAVKVIALAMFSNFSLITRRRHKLGTPHGPKQEIEDIIDTNQKRVKSVDPHVTDSFTKLTKTKGENTLAEPRI